MSEPLTPEALVAMRERCARATLSTDVYRVDARVGCVAVYSGDQENCLSGMSASPRCVFYKSGTKDEAGNWTVDPADEALAQRVCDAMNESAARPALFALIADLLDVIAEQSEAIEDLRLHVIAEEGLCPVIERTEAADDIGDKFLTPAWRSVATVLKREGT